MRRILTVVLLLAATGCRSDDGESAVTTAEPTDSTATAANCTADDADPVELEPLLVDDVAGFEVVAPNLGGNGPADLSEAAEADGQSDARDVLTELRYRRGYQRRWSNELREDVALHLYEFCDQAGADGWQARTRDALEGLGVEARPFATDPAMSGFTVDDGEWVVAYVSATAGSRLVLAFTSVRGRGDLAEVQTRATDLVAAQLARL